MQIVDITVSLRAGSDSEIRLAFECQRGVREVEIAASLFGAQGDGVATFSTRLTGHQLNGLPEDGVNTCRIPRSPLLPGTYSVNVRCTVMGEVADWVRGHSLVGGGWWRLFPVWAYPIEQERLRDDRPRLGSRPDLVWNLLPCPDV